MVIRRAVPDLLHALGEADVKILVVHLPIYLYAPKIMKSSRMRWEGHVARMGENRNAYRLPVGKPEGKRPLGRTRRRWVDNIRMDLGEVGWGDVDWIGLA
jgi:hypothetical protein